MQDTNKLWNLVKSLKSPEYKWIDLTHELSPETPHWYGFKPLTGELLFDYTDGTQEEKLAPMRCHQWSVASQYGTHTDVPVHFHEEGRDMSQISLKELVYPLVVIDKSKECEENPDYTLSVDDIIDWESEHGTIPPNSFIAFRTDWYKKDDIENKDENGQPHYPGWDIEAIKFRVNERNIGAIGHETADTDPSTITTVEDSYPYPGEQYILAEDKIQIEVMRNLDQLPATGSIIFIGFPKLKNGTGFPTRVYAIAPAFE